MERPVYYMQTDKKWGSVDYSTSGEHTNIAKSGCGPTCMAMVIATWKDKSVSPYTTAKWSLAHGYKAKNQGTYYTYFKPQGKAYGLNCYQLNPSNIYKNSSSKYHNLAKEEVKKGNFVSACMGKGHWTSSGHFVLWYAMDGNNVLINDPASTKEDRHKASFDLFKSQVKYYFVCENPNKNNAVNDDKGSENEEMTQQERNEFLGYINKLGERVSSLENQNMVYNYVDKNMPTWAKDTVIKLVNKGLLKGDENGLGLTHDLMKLLVILDRANLFD